MSLSPYYLFPPLPGLRIRRRSREVARNEAVLSGAYNRLRVLEAVADDYAEGVMPSEAEISRRAEITPAAAHAHLHRLRFYCRTPGHVRGHAFLTKDFVRKRFIEMHFKISEQILSQERGWEYME